MSISVIKRVYVTRDDTITHEENNLVTLVTKDGTTYSSLEPRRLFPVSRGDVYITLLDTDGNETALIRSIGELSPESKRVVCESLDDYYLVPSIIRIISVTEKYGNLHWTVETDRGVKSFDVRDRNHDVKVYPDGRVRVRDSDDNRYTIDNWRKLDKHSKSQLIADI